MAVTTDEINGSPFGSFSDGEYQITRMVVLDWSDRDAFIAELLPPPIVAGGQIVQFPPQLFPGSTLFRVRGFDWAPYFSEDDRSISADADGNNVYDKIKFTITYGVPRSIQVEDDPGGQEFSTDPVPFLQHDIKHGGKFFRISVTGWQWLTAAGAQDTAVPEFQHGLFISTTQHNVTWDGVTSPNWSNLELFKGHVNSAAISLRGYQYPAGALQYLGYDGQESVLSDGQLSWSLVMHFESEQKPAAQSVIAAGDGAAGPNYFWDESVGKFRKMVEVTSGNVGKVYPESDLSLLFTAG